VLQGSKHWNRTGKQDPDAQNQKLWKQDLGYQDKLEKAKLIDLQARQLDHIAIIIYAPRMTRSQMVQKQNLSY
jgi:hypothetical protein